MGPLTFAYIPLSLFFSLEKKKIQKYKLEKKISSKSSSRRTKYFLRWKEYFLKRVSSKNFLSIPPFVSRGKKYSAYKKIVRKRKHTPLSLSTKTGLSPSMVRCSKRVMKSFHFLRNSLDYNSMFLTQINILGYSPFTRRYY